jgi:aquaporin Z
MRAYLTEAVGTFFLVLTIGLTTNAASPLAPVAIGLGLMVMVYAGANASGAHYNPAVTLGLTLSGALDRSKVAGYWAAQLLGAIVASVLTMKFTGQPPLVAPAESTTVLKALTGEAIATFALAYVVMHVATGKGRAGNSYYGLAIGATVAAMAVAFGGITGGAFNPAVGFGTALSRLILGRGFDAGSWVYIVGPMAGAAVAAPVFKYQESAA